MSDDAPLTVVNVISVSYSGSTWLGLMLGTHPQVLCLGEMKLVRHNDHRSDCALHGERCPLWSRFDRGSEENPFHQLARLSGYRMFVVNNSRKLLPRQREPGVRPLFIHLIRDGRAVTASMLRKNWVPTMWHAARQWRHDVRRNQRLMRRQPAADQFAVRYEDLTVDKPAELSRICRFLGLDYDPAMIDFWEAEHHPIGGNVGTMVTVARRNATAEVGQAEQLLHKTGNKNWDIGYYNQQEDPRNLRDERWKQELRDQQLRLFGLIAGRLNHRFGYPRSLDRQSPPATLRC